MNKEYGYTKQAESNHQGSKHTLAILLSKLRSSLGAAWEQPGSSLGAAWEQPGSSLEYAYSMLMMTFLRPFSSKRAELERRLTLDDITARRSRDYGSLMTRLRLTISMLLMLTLGSSSVWGQDYSGVYYIGTAGYNANTPANNFYLCPTEGWIYYKPDDKWSDDGTTYPNPFLTTYKCKTNAYHSGDPNDAIWYVEKHPTLNYYYIRHASDGKYVMSNGQIDGTTNANRMRVHLEAVAPEDLDDKALFSIYSYSGYLVISPKSPAGWNGNYKWYTVNNGNKGYLVGNGSNGGPSGHTETGGIIGTYSENDANAKFYLENALSIVAPTITNKNDGTFTITADGGATIYYTIDGTEPTISSSTYSTPITQTESLTVIKAIAKATSDPFPTNVTTYYLPVCERPVISVSGSTVTITCTTEGATIHYTTDGSPATSTSTVYTGPFAKGDASTFRAIATKTGYVTSSEAILLPPTEVSSSSQITNMNGSYILASNFTSSGSIGTADNPFKGIINGNLNTLTLGGYPLVAYADGATIKNVILDNVSISSGNENGNAGAICCEATGDTRIYNCGVLSGSVGGSEKVGGIVGLLDGTARVINCYSYADITGGTTVGGIVGYNNVATTATNLKTMVMNCMFYGNITGGDTKSPVYGGKNINNNQGGLNTFNYYSYEKLTGGVTDNQYNCALAVEDKYLNRFEFYRLLLNSNKKLAAYYATGSAENGDKMAKWVLETADRTIDNPKPYPVLKAQGYYPSIVNPDIEHAPDSASVGRNHGGKLGDKTLSVTINLGSGAPTDASITTGSLTLTRTDKDFDRFNFNYDKVQLPYYNDVGTGNYTDYKVVTGWKITAITAVEGDPYTSANYPTTGITDFPNHNYADRKSSNKDLYSVSKRVFSQGAYFDVPYGVTSITIEPYWGTAVYVADQYYDVVYKNDYTGKQGVSQVGTQAVDNTTEFNGQKVRTSITGLGSTMTMSQITV